MLPPFTSTNAPRHARPEGRDRVEKRPSAVGSNVLSTKELRDSEDRGAQVCGSDLPPGDANNTRMATTLRYVTDETNSRRFRLSTAPGGRRGGLPKSGLRHRLGTKLAAGLRLAVTSEEETGGSAKNRIRSLIVASAERLDPVLLLGRFWA
jgi:hypothetical protein